MKSKSFFTLSDKQKKQMIERVAKESNEEQAKLMKSTMLATSTWTATDTYEAVYKVPRLRMLLMLIRGKIIISWPVEKGKKRKGLYIKGELRRNNAKE